MKFEENKKFERLGEKSGYLFSYMIFTTVLFFILMILGRMPDGWSYLSVMGITLVITFLGIFLRKVFE